MNKYVVGSEELPIASMSPKCSRIQMQIFAGKIQSIFLSKPHLIFACLISIQCHSFTKPLKPVS